MQIRLQIGLEDHLKTRADCNKLAPTHYIPPSLYLPCISLLEAYIVEYCGVKWRIILSI